jgi:chorismate dehydratase
MPPSHVANGLRARSLDVGLVPAVELIRQPSLRVVSNACIASYGPVDSVLLLLRTEPQAVRHVVLDPHSRTSQVLALIVLKELYGVEPEFDLADPQAAFDAGATDAALVIGDPALRRFVQGGRFLDLSEAWRRLTGHPFIFAVWAESGLSEPRREELRQVLTRARDLGIADERPIQQACDRMPDLDETIIRKYLRDRIHYSLDTNEKKGLDAFLQRAKDRWVDLVVNRVT